MKTPPLELKNPFVTNPFDILNKRFEKMPGTCQRVMTTWLDTMQKYMPTDQSGYCSCPCKKKLQEREIAQKEIEVEFQALDAWRNLKIFPR